MVRSGEGDSNDSYDEEMGEEDVRFWSVSAWLVMTALGSWLFYRYAFNPSGRGIEVPFCRACGDMNKPDPRA